MNSKVWAADQVERRAVASLKPYERNSRTHSPEQIQQIAAAIERWGWTTPILISPEGMIIAGHGRHAAALQLGIEEVPVTVARGWSKDEIRAFVIADNKIALNAGWDEDLLRLEILDLQEVNFDVGAIGFDDKELSKLLGDIEADVGRPDGPGLSERFGIPPFSVMNAREGWWQDRKRAWLALGIQSELGRGEQLVPNGGGLNSKARYDKTSPGGSARPATDYSKTKARGNGIGRAVA